MNTFLNASLERSECVCEGQFVVLSNSLCLACGSSKISKEWHGLNQLTVVCVDVNMLSEPLFLESFLLN
jgi:RNA polymerase subunit RPABC4/transcription elongation factor Spt4